jgi:hypothetical protein
MGDFPRPTGLSDIQITLVTNAAALVRAELRDLFLVGVADILAEGPNGFNDDDVVTACRCVYMSLGSPPLWGE